jgi:hypothetical protein
MQFIRQNILLKYLWIGLALFIFNVSIDTPDAFGDEVAEDLSFNDIESISELVLEDILGIYNAFPEHDENDREDEGGFCKKIDFQFNQNSSITVDTKVNVFNEERILSVHNTPQPVSPFLQGLIKPPQV